MRRMRMIAATMVTATMVTAMSATVGSAWGQEAASSFQELIRHAVASQAAGDFAGAASAYRSALNLEPNDVATHVNLGVVLVQLRHFEEALDQYRAADKILPGEPRIKRNIGLAYEKSGNITEARNAFEQVHAALPDDWQSTILLADAELQLGNTGRVIELLQPLEATHPDDGGIAYLLGSAQFRSGNMPAAVSDLSRAAEQSHPAPPGLQALYGRALLMTGDPQSAADAFTKELTGNPDNYDSNLGKAQIDIVRRNFAEARPLVERALAVRKDDPSAKLAMAECLVGGNRFAEARPWAETATRALPDSVEAHQTLAAVYDGLNLPQPAKAEHKQAAALRAAADPGPGEGELAPDFSLGDTNLQSLRSKGPVVLVFGSYTCPNFRDASPALRTLNAKYGGRVSFQLIYIREAHSTADWQTGRNTREGDVKLQPAATMTEKHGNAAMCMRSLHLRFPFTVDRMDGAVEQAYRAWPSRIFVVGKNGRILYGSRLTEFEFHPDQMEQVLKQALQ